MNDYGKAQAYLARAGRVWNHPGKQAKKPARVPSAWTGDPYEWDACMRELGFDDVDTNRWCATIEPTKTTFGWCVIVSLNEQKTFELHMTIDTEENEQDSPWVIPSARFNTPLEAAQAGLAMVLPLNGVR